MSLEIGYITQHIYTHISRGLEKNSDKKIYTNFILLLLLSSLLENGKRISFIDSIEATKKHAYLYHEYFIYYDKIKATRNKIEKSVEKVRQENQ